MTHIISSVEMYQLIIYNSLQENNDEIKGETKVYALEKICC